MSINSSCFIGNKAYGNALVVSYGEEFGNMTNNYGLDNTVVWNSDVGLQCTFAALVDANYQNAECSEFDASTCASFPTPLTPAPQLTSVPAPPPTPVPQATSVPAPTLAPVPQATSVPAPTPASQTNVPASSPQPMAAPIAAPMPERPEMPFPPTSSASNIRVAPIITAVAIIAIMT